MIHTKISLANLVEGEIIKILAVNYPKYFNTDEKLGIANFLINEQNIRLEKAVPLNCSGWSLLPNLWPCIKSIAGSILQGFLVLVGLWGALRAWSYWKAAGGLFTGLASVSDTTWGPMVRAATRTEEQTRNLLRYLGHSQTEMSSRTKKMLTDLDPETDWGKFEAVQKASLKDWVTGDKAVFGAAFIGGAAGNVLSNHKIGALGGAIAMAIAHLGSLGVKALILTIFRAVQLLMQHNRSAATRLVDHLGSVSRLADHAAELAINGNLDGAMKATDQIRESITQAIIILRTVRVKGDSFERMNSVFDEILQHIKSVEVQMQDIAKGPVKITDPGPQIETILKSMARTGSEMPEAGNLVKMYKQVANIADDESADAALRVFDRIIPRLDDLDNNTAYNWNWTVPGPDAQYGKNLKELQRWLAAARAGSRGELIDTLETLHRGCKDQSEALARIAASPTKKVAGAPENNDWYAIQLLYDMLFVAREEAGIRAQLTGFAPMSGSGATAAAARESLENITGQVKTALENHGRVLMDHKDVRVYYGSKVVQAAAGIFTLAGISEIYGLKDDVLNPNPDTATTTPGEDVSRGVVTSAAKCVKSVDITHAGLAGDAITAHNTATLAFNLHCIAEDPWRYLDPKKQWLWNGNAFGEIEEDYKADAISRHSGAGGKAAWVKKIVAKSITQGEWLHDIKKDLLTGFKDAYMVKAAIVEDGNKHYFQPQDCNGIEVEVPYLSDILNATGGRFNVHDFRPGEKAGWGAIYGYAVWASQGSEINANEIINNLKNWAASTRK